MHLIYIFRIFILLYDSNVDNYLFIYTQWNLKYFEILKDQKQFAIGIKL